MTPEVHQVVGRLRQRAVPKVFETIQFGSYPGRAAQFTVRACEPVSRPVALPAEGATSIMTRLSTYPMFVMVRRSVVPFILSETRK